MSTHNVSCPPAAIRGFLDSEFEPCAPEKAFFHILPAPYEKTVSFGGGAALGPDAIIEASGQLEAFDGYSEPGEAGIFTRENIDCSGDAENALRNIEHATRQALNCEAMPVLLGGEHTVTLGALRALKEHHGHFGVLQFDAHADLRDEYQGTPFSHACVMRRAVDDLGLRLAQAGVRDFCREEAETRIKFNVIRHDAADLAVNGLPEVVLPPDFPQKIYITFDVDAFDSSLMPATGTPSPGGLFWHQALEMVRRAVVSREVIGLDVVEFAPMPGWHAADFTAAKLVYHLMGIIRRNAENPK